MEAQAQSTVSSMETVETLIQKHGRTLLLALGIGALLLMFLFRFSSSSSQGARLDYQLATIDFQKLQGALGNDDQSLQELRTLLARRPDLHAKFDGTLAQLLLGQGRTADALPFANQCLSRLEQRHLSSSFHDFSRLSLLMAQKKYTEAWAAVDKLQEQLKRHAQEEGVAEGQAEPYQALYLYTLLQRAAIAQQLEKSADELNAWDRVETFLKRRDPAALAKLNRQVQENFQSGKVSLMEYMAYRRRQITR